MQDNNTKKPKSRKAWYQKAKMQVANLWRIVLRPPPPSADHCSAASKYAKLRKCFSTSSSAISGKTAAAAAPSGSVYYCTVPASVTPPRTPPRTLSYPSSLTRSFLCAPVAYTGGGGGGNGCGGGGDHGLLPPRRSNAAAAAATREEQPGFVKGRLSNGGSAQTVVVNGAVAAITVAASPPRRRVFRGKSVMENSLMRKAVIEEEAMMMMKRRNEFAFIQRRNSLKRRQIGPSPLSRVAYNDIQCE